MSYPEKYDLSNWFPTTAKEVKRLGWDSIDVILFTGDAYVDHPSFGVAVIARVLQKLHLRVAIIPQPNWKDDLRDFKKLGAPNLFFGVTSGNMDSMVNHYTANKRLRSNDAYTPDGRAGARPDYAVTIYCNILKDIYPGIPIIVGGVESSLRRLAHYDYWSDSLKPSVLIDCKADLLFYGMAEKSLSEFVHLLQKGVPFQKIKNIPQTCYVSSEKPQIDSNKEHIELFSYEECLDDKIKYAQNFKHIEQESNAMQSKLMYQKHGHQYVIVNPMYPPEKDGAIDQWYDLKYTRLPHPKYWNKGRIPAYEMIKFSINMHRGCFGGCSFCTISAHQGKFISNRSKKSILKEAQSIIKDPDFKGYFSDLGGPSANMYRMKGKNQDICKSCYRPSCIFPKVCSNLNTNHDYLLDIYQSVRELKGVKKAFIGSGIRYDLVLAQDYGQAKSYLTTVMKHHVSGRLKVAPEHTSDKVLKIMRKPNFKNFETFNNMFNEINEKEQLNEYLIPYFISSHPGCEGIDMADLAVKTKAMNFNLEQVQDFTPTPMTVATVIYYSGVHPYTLKPLYTAKNQKDKKNQRQYFFWYKKEFQAGIRKDLQKWKRQDLLQELLTPLPSKKSQQNKAQQSKPPKPKYKPNPKRKKRR